MVGFKEEELDQLKEVLVNPRTEDSAFDEILRRLRLLQSEQ